MTKQVQTEKNIQLSEELMNYLISKKIKSKPNYSYVIFVEGDKELNKMNMNLVKELIEEGKRVISAEKTKNIKNPWKLKVVFNP